MTTHARLLAGVAVLALGLCLLGAGTAADDKKDVREAVLKVAADLEKGNASAAKDGAKQIAKDFELDEAMHLFQLRSKKGLGVGDKPGAVMPDGIEAKFINLGKKALPAKQLDKEADALAKAAYVSAALGEIAGHKAPEKKEKNKDPKDWVAWSKEMSATSLELAKAAKAKNANGVKDAASKLNSSCNNCHSAFRD